jgi:LytS/YehU family sensor histidine kinase
MAINAEKFEREGIEAKYDALRNQVNPHFLFNSLNALTNLVYEDQGKAVTFIKQLSDVYRYVLDTREKEIVPLEEELKFLKSYSFLQQIRFGDNLKIDMMLNNVEGMVAPLSLQMLVENCIKHNIVSVDDPLSIRIFCEGGFLVVENIVNRKSSGSESSSGLGLDNIRNRYKFLSDIPVEVSDANGKFIVKLPILK